MFHGIEIDLGKERSSCSIGFTRLGLIFIEIIFNQPVIGRDIGHEVSAVQNIGPEGGAVSGTREQSAGTYNGNAAVRRVDFVCHQDFPRPIV